MSLTSDIQEWRIKALPGMNSKTEDLELNDKFVELAYNCRFSGEPGSVDKRDPITYYNSSSAGAGPTLGLYRFYSKAGLLKTIAIHGTSAYVGSDSAGTLTSIRSNLTSGKRMAFETYRDLCIMSNGYDNPFVYDGATDNVTWELGACKAVLLAGGANLDASATYYYAVTIDADAYVCGAVSNTVTTGSAGNERKVTLSNIPLGPVGTVNRKIYRTVGGGSSLLLLATIADNTTTTYVDDIDDGTLGAAMPAVNDDMPVGNILKLHRERLFISGNPSFPNRVYYSNPYLPGYIQQTTNTDYMEIAADDGDSIEGIPIQLGVMACIKKNTVRRVFITSATSGADPATWYAEDPISFTGCPYRWSIVQTQYGVVFMGWDHWKIYNGANVADVIDEFDVNDILASRKTEIFSFWTQDDILLTAYTDATAGSSFNDRVMRYDFKRKALSIDTVNVNCMHANTGTGDTGELLYGSSSAGYVYKTDNSPVYYKLQTKTQALLGTQNTTYVGGTESEPYIQIGSTTTASEIAVDMCIFWDDAVTSPGAGWTELTTKNDKFIKFTTDAVGTTGEITLSDTTEADLYYHKLRLFRYDGTTNITEFPDGSIVMYDQPADPTGFVRYGSDGYFVQINQTPGTGITSLQLTTGAGGTNLDQRVSFRFIKKTGEADTYTGTDTYVYCPYYAAGAPGNDFSDVTATYASSYLVNAATGPTATTGATTTETDFIHMSGTTHTYADGGTGTGPETIDGDNATYYGFSGSDTGSGSGGVFQGGTANLVRSVHEFRVARTIDSITYRAYATATSSGTDDNHASARIHIQYATSAAPTTWVDFTGGSVEAGPTSNTTVTVGSTSSSTTITQTVTDVKSVRVYVTNSGSHHNGTGGSHSWDLRIYEISCTGSFAQYVTMRLAKKVLGKFQDYNSAIASNTQYGTWVSPGIHINAEALGSMYWNEDKLSGDEIEFFTRTGATQASVEDGTAIGLVTNATNLFTQAGHGLSNTNRITIGATVMPTGLVKTRVYFVVGVAGNDFQVALTSGGSAVDFSTDGTAVTFKKWSESMSDPNGTAMTSTANIWIQYLVAFTAADSTADNPTIEFTGGYVDQFGYQRGITTAEDSVAFRYKTGFRHFDAPWVDKIFKKILSYFVGDTGQVLITWETENETATFTVDLTSYPTRFESFFPDTAWGRKLSIEFYKNDLYDFKIKEVSGFYTQEPAIV